MQTERVNVGAGGQAVQSPINWSWENRQAVDELLQKHKGGRKETFGCR